MRRFRRPRPLLTLLAILGLGWTPMVVVAQEAAAPPVLCLDVTRDFRIQDNDAQQTLTMFREMMRQSLLIAARHDFGLVTRDQVLGDAMPESGAMQAYELAIEPGEPNKITLLVGHQAPRKAVGSFEWSSQGIGRYRFWYAAWEEKSRTEMPKLLAAAGFTAKPLTWKDDAPVPEDVETLLQEMTYLAQFRAAQKLHALMREDGESPARLAAISRCYAHLAMLTEVHWSQERHVFLGRAALYAQRLAARLPNNSMALWNRAYLYSLGGMHLNAIQDLDTAEQASDRAASVMPYWIEVGKLNARCDMNGLVDLKSREPKAAQLCDLLRYHAVEQSGDHNHAVAMALEVLPGLPECFRIHDGLCQNGGVSVLHGATMQAPQVFAETLHARLGEIDELPAGVKRRVKEASSGGGILGNLFGDDESPVREFKLRVRLIKALRDATLATSPAPKPDAKSKAKPAVLPAASDFDLHEPSWAVLAKAIEEISFLHAMRRVTFEDDGLGVDAEESIALFQPLVVSHPYRSFLETCSWDNEIRTAATKKLQAALNTDTTPIHARPLIDAVWQMDKESAQKLYNAAWAARSNTLFDLAVRHRLSPDSDESTAYTLSIAMPFAPLGRMIKIRDSWHEVKDKAAEWEQDAQSWPKVLRTLGAKYRQLQQWDAAERCLKRAIEVDPSRENYLGLAYVYRDQDKEDLWLSTLEEFLQKPDYALGHANIRVYISDQYSQRREWEKAAPYANEAAESWAAWAMLSAARVNEALEDFETAEQWYANASERYRGSALEWYFYCRRTGQGRLDEAMALADNAIDEKAEFGDINIATYYTLADQHDEAVKYLVSMFEYSENPTFAMLAALAAHSAGDAKRRDELLNAAKQAVAKDPGDKPRTDLVAVADMFLENFKHDQPAPLDLTIVEKLPMQRTTWEEATFRYIIGKYLAFAGQKDEAICQFKFIVAIPEPAADERTLAAVELRTLGVKPEEYLGLLRTGFPPNEEAGAEN